MLTSNNQEAHKNAKGQQTQIVSENNVSVSELIVALRIIGFFASLWTFWLFRALCLMLDS